MPGFHARPSPDPNIPCVNKSAIGTKAVVLFSANPLLEERGVNNEPQKYSPSPLPLFATLRSNLKHMVAQRPGETARK